MNIFLLDLLAIQYARVPSPAMTRIENSLKKKLFDSIACMLILWHRQNETFVAWVLYGHFWPRRHDDGACR